MIILSHRGYWKTPEEKNTRKAFIRSFELGFGTETDVRDLIGKLVISHDIPTGKEMTFEEFLEIHSKYHNGSLPLAINIKADGLQTQLKELLERFGVRNYFVFDMSLPDSLGYLKQDMIAFTRESEYEKNPMFYEDAKGVWIDCFKGDWIDLDAIQKHLDKGKKVAIVSPELHGRAHHDAWAMYKAAPQDVILCTDIPQEADKYFNS